MVNKDFTLEPRFAGLVPFQEKVWLSSPTMHGNEIEYIKEAYVTNWMSTVGRNIDELERNVADFVGVKYGVALCAGTAALHLAVKAAAKRLYHSSSGVSTPDGPGRGGALLGRRICCSDLTFSATVNPVIYEGGEAVFIDAERDTWNMDPEALEKALNQYSDIRLVICAHLYGTPGKIDELKDICRRHDALLIEDAAESLGAAYKGRQTGSFGDFNIISFNGNKIVTGSSGGMFLTDSRQDADTVRKWSTQSREQAPWYQHEEVGYNYRMSNVIAGVVRGQLPHIAEHVRKKRRIFERYRDGLKDLPVAMNPYDPKNSSPNFWLSCLLINKEAMCKTRHQDREATYGKERGKTCPMEILEALEAFHAEGRPIWKPMHMQPLYKNNIFVASQWEKEAGYAYMTGEFAKDVGMDLFNRGLCLPSDIKMTEAQQDMIIEIIHRCFQ